MPDKIVVTRWRAAVRHKMSRCLKNSTISLCLASTLEKPRINKKQDRSGREAVIQHKFEALLKSKRKITSSSMRTPSPPRCNNSRKRSLVKPEGDGSSLMLPTILERKAKML